MTSKTIANGIIRAVAIIASFVLFLFFIYKIRSVIAYIAIAAVISLIGLPIVRILKTKLKFKKTIAVVVTMVLLLGLVIGLVGLFIPMIVEQGHNLSLLNIESLEENIINLNEHIVSYFSNNNIEIDSLITKKAILSKIDFSLLPTFLNGVVSGFGSFSIALFSVLFISFFLLKDSKLLEHAIVLLVPKGKEKRIAKSIDSIKNLLSRYFVGLVFQILILFIIYTIILLIFGVNNAFVIAFLCALLNLIPYVGPVIGGVLMMFLTMSSFIGSDFQSVILPKTIYVMLGFLFGQLIDNFFSQPVIFSKSVKSHPLEIFLVILIAGLLFGVLGLIIAIPAYTTIRVILKEFFSENKIVQQLTKNL